MVFHPVLIASGNKQYVSLGGRIRHKQITSPTYSAEAIHPG